MSRRSKLCSFIFVIIIVCTFLSISAEAFGFNETQTYNYSYQKDVIPAPAAYSYKCDITGKRLGIAELEEISDVCVRNNKIYILDCATQAGRIIVLNNDYSVYKEITTLFDDHNNPVVLNHPKGLFVDKNNLIYIADTGNGRIVVAENTGKVHLIINEPDRNASMLTVQYEPVKVCADQDQRVYVLAKNQTNGIMQFTRDGEFMGYFGATLVKPSAVELFWRRFSTKAQKARMRLFIPTEYSNFDIDNEGFLYVTVDQISDNDIYSFINSGGTEKQSAPIRKLNPGGTDVLIRNGNIAPAGDYILPLENVHSSKLSDIALGPNGIYSVLDSLRGRIFTYDASGNLLYIFGNQGDSKELFTEPESLIYSGMDILITEPKNKMIKIYEPTEFTQNVHTAIRAQYDGDKKLEYQAWNHILDSYMGYDLAYVGIGKQQMSEGKYKQAMETFRLGNSKSYYSKALKMYRQEVGYNNLGIVLLFVVMIGLLLFLVIKVIKKKKFRIFEKLFLGKREKIEQVLKGVKYGFYIIRHPFDGFWDMKFEKRGNALSATIIMVLAVLLNIVSIGFTGYVFASDSQNTNIILGGIAGIVLPIGLWIVANWSVTTLKITNGLLILISKFYRNIERDIQVNLCTRVKRA